MAFSAFLFVSSCDHFMTWLWVESKDEELHHFFASILIPFPLFSSQFHFSSLFLSFTLSCKELFNNQSLQINFVQLVVVEQLVDFLFSFHTKTLSYLIFFFFWIPLELITSFRVSWSAKNLVAQCGLIKIMISIFFDNFMNL